MREVVWQALLFAGVLVLVLCSAGVLVMRDPFDRLHYAAAGGWGALLVAIAILVHESFSLIANKALALAMVLVLSGPVLAHATARAGRIRSRGTWRSDRSSASERGPESE